METGNFLASSFSLPASFMPPFNQQSLCAEPRGHDHRKPQFLLLSDGSNSSRPLGIHRLKGDGAGKKTSTVCRGEWPGLADRAAGLRGADTDRKLKDRCSPGSRKSDTVCKSSGGAGGA